MNAREWLEFLFGAAPVGRVSLWRQPDKLSHHALTPADAAVVADKWAAAGCDVYFGVGTRRSDLGAAKRGGKRDVFELPGLFVDVDMANPQAHKSLIALPPDENAVAGLLGAVGVEPTAIVHSGYGVHAYYLFNTPLVCTTPQTEAQGYEDLLGKVQDLVIGAAAAKGWHVDRLAECARVLRVPGTRNFKVTGDPKDVYTMTTDGPRYDFVSLAARFGQVAPGARTLVQVPASPPTPTVSITGPVVPMADLRGKLSRLKDPVKAAMAARLLLGASYADAERDRAMQTLCSIVAWMAPDNDPAVLVDDLFKASHTQWAADPAATKTLAEEQQKALEKLTRAQADARAERDRVAAEDKGIKDILGFQEVVTAAEKAATYTTEELLAAADVAHCSLEELTKLWVIQVGDAFYVLTDVIGGRFAYSQPQKKVALRGLPTWLKRAPIVWTKYEKRQIVPKSTDELLDDYCTVALSVQASLTLEHSYLDINTYTFHEAACPPRSELKPVFSKDVHDWLVALGGADAELLLDWVATVTDLTIPSCALYLSGPPGTGKSLLANGLARIWTTGTPTDMGRVIGDGFNEDLTKCPLVFADEALPTDWRGKQTSTALRALITRNRCTLSRKYMANSSLEGCIRVMMAANNDAMLAFNEDMTPDDIRAMAERFLHIDCTGSAQHLKNLGPEHVVGWVDQDIIAQHALWLRANRAVQRTGRLAVTGHVSRIHQAIATRGTVKGLVVEWLAGYLNRPSQAIPSTAPVRAGGGAYLINTKVVSEFWEQYITSDRVPTTGVVSRVLKGLSTGREVRLGGVRCHEIDVAAVIQWVNETGAGNPDDMLARVNQPIAVEEEEKKPVDKAPPATVHDLKAIINNASK